MPYLFRTPVLIARKELYLGPSTFEQPTLEQALDPIWESIFEEELFGWSTDR